MHNFDLVKLQKEDAPFNISEKFSQLIARKAVIASTWSVHKTWWRLGVSSIQQIPQKIQGQQFFAFVNKNNWTDAIILCEFETLCWTFIYEQALLASASALKRVYIQLGTCLWSSSTAVWLRQNILIEMKNRPTLHRNELVQTIITMFSHILQPRKSVQNAREKPPCPHQTKVLFQQSVHKFCTFEYDVNTSIPGKIEEVSIA